MKNWNRYDDFIKYHYEVGGKIKPDLSIKWTRDRAIKAMKGNHNQMGVTPEHVYCLTELAALGYRYKKSLRRYKMKEVMEHLRDTMLNEQDKSRRDAILDCMVQATISYAKITSD